MYMHEKDFTCRNLLVNDGQRLRPLCFLQKRRDRELSSMVLPSEYFYKVVPMETCRFGEWPESLIKDEKEKNEGSTCLGDSHF